MPYMGVMDYSGLDKITRHRTSNWSVWFERSLVSFPTDPEGYISHDSIMV